METHFCYRYFIIVVFCFVINNGLKAKVNDGFDEPDNFVSSKCFALSYSPAKEDGSSVGLLQSFNDWPREKKVLALNLTAVGAIAAVGAVSWEYGNSSFHFHNEGWFAGDTKYGGVDKIGHAFGAYALTSIYNNLYKKWGYSDQEAILGAALSSWSQMMLIEIGDGFSDEHGFSWEDGLMDTIGVGMAYLRHRFPSIRNKIDFRLEWFPSSALRHGDQSDIFTDYSGQKYLLAIKPDGFLKTNNSFLKAMEIHFGYYTRGYDGENDSSSQHRRAYMGIGLNVTYLLEQLTGHDAWRVFDYIQVPCTYISSSSEYH